MLILMLNWMSRSGKSSYYINPFRRYFTSLLKGREKRAKQTDDIYFLIDQFFRELSAWLLESSISKLWRGPLLDRAYNYLQNALQVHDDASRNYPYRIVVIEALLSAEKVLPEWLVKGELEIDVGRLIRMGLKFGKVEETLGWTSEKLEKVSS